MLKDRSGPQPLENKTAIPLLEGGLFVSGLLSKCFIRRFCTVPHYKTSHNSAGVFTPDSFFTVGMRTPPETASIRLFPNPAEDYINIIIPPNILVSIFLTDLEGQELIEKNISSDEIKLDVSSIKSGVYLVRIFSEKWIVTRRIIIQH